MEKVTAEVFSKITRTEVNVNDLAAFTSEDEFMSLTVDLAVETGKWICLAACTMGEQASWSRDEAAIGGNMVRMHKLVDAMIDQTCQHRGEMSFMLARLVFETVVNTDYLIANYSTALVDSYVEFSLRHEKKLWQHIAQQIVDRKGILLPIEDRMQQSIERTFNASGMRIDDIDLKNKAPWGGKNLYDKAAAVGLGPLYLSAFGGTSHGVHGSWGELYGNHLEWDGSGFTPNLEWQRPRPQVLLALCPVLIETIYAYFSFISKQSMGDLVADTLSDLRNRILTVSAAHEAYLAGKKWPEI